MTKSTSIAVAALAAISIFGFIAINQFSKRKALEEKLVGQPSASSLISSDRTSEHFASQREPLSDGKRIADLEAQLAAETERRKAAEQDSESVRDAVAGQVVVSFGRVNEIGRDSGILFKEAFALQELEDSGELTTEEDRSRLKRVKREMGELMSLSASVLEIENDPEEGSQLFSSFYRSVFDLDEPTAESLKSIFFEQLKTAKESELTAVHNPNILRMKGEGDSLTATDTVEWINKRSRFFQNVRQQVRDQLPAEKLEFFDTAVENHGIGFNNIKIGGEVLRFSLDSR